ncbi:hypothetical protein [Vibrio mimicus]|uniref:hypothetical protein n=1 Tax=Vibrio mimicus TaxID=674 RepID=UPI002F9225B4
MKLKELIALDKLQETIDSQGSHLSLSMAKDIAYDLASASNKQSINTTYKIYNELHASELTTQKVIEAIEIFVSYLPSKDAARFVSYAYPTLKT